MKLYSGQKIDGWRKIYGLWFKRVFIGLAIAPREDIKEEKQ